MLTSDRKVATPKEFLVISITVYKDDRDREKEWKWRGRGNSWGSPSQHISLLCSQHDLNRSLLKGKQKFIEAIKVPYSWLSPC